MNKNDNSGPGFLKPFEYRNKPQQFGLSDQERYIKARAHHSKQVMITAAVVFFLAQIVIFWLCEVPA